MSFTGSVIEFLFYFLDELVRDGREVRGLREVLSYKPVYIFVGPSLPTVIRPCKEEIDVEIFGDLLVQGEFFSVV